MINWKLLVTVVSFIISTGAVALILFIARRENWYDKIDDRKVHTGNIPRLGGIGFAFAFLAVSIFLFISFNLFSTNLYSVVVLLAMFIILQFGIIDDFKSLKPRVKFLIQCIAALGILLSGLSYQKLFLVDFFGITSISWIGYPITFIFIVGLTNAVNIIDGVDGLAGGVSALIAITYGIIFSSHFNDEFAVLLCICLAASIGGFLVFNLPIPKAKIFMGDGGSQFLGFVLAVLPIMHRGRADQEIPLFYVVALLIIPIFDTIAAIWRRLRDGRRIDSPDKLHIHHKLMNLGLSSRGIIGVLYTLQIVLGVLVFLSTRIPGKISLLFLLLAYIIGTGFFTAIHYMNISVLKKQESLQAAE
ncbi:MAG: undecaprenyl/decaprenyl-phosphate alpha-N-acetylglucosaminyl 1-phosphate transferase [Treponema sp.]|nr:undecaprenyl/decaprenyl-phosphate alpha-N-acetylglucosaminyl 1-phosphate transferase [Treponema sp.]